MAVNPKGYVPALRLDDGSILTEGPAIVQYLADSKPASGLAPAAGTIDRYRLQKWLTFIGTELHKSFSPLFNRASSDDVQLAGRNRRITGIIGSKSRPCCLSRIHGRSIRLIGLPAMNSCTPRPKPETEASIADCAFDESSVP